MRRRGITARCANGPYVGQTFVIPFNILDKVHYRPDVWSGDIGPLVWIIYGGDHYCYQFTSNGWYKGWRLVYRDTF